MQIGHENRRKDDATQVVMNEFGKLLKDWTDDNDIVFVYMSW